MYSTCIYCHKPLGRNEVIEHFPVGRRLAFDAAKGRLWVVCRACERWNLSPLETRWEAIEECEERFRVTRLRMSTDQIGLARVSEGLELVRIGQPQRPEFAAWRYGDQFGRRRRRAIMVAGGFSVAVGAIVVGASAAGIGIGGFGGIWGQLPQLFNAMRSLKIKTADGRVLKVRGNNYNKIAMVRDPRTHEPTLGVTAQGGRHVFSGEEALRLASRLLPAINYSGGNKTAVSYAVLALEGTRGGPERFIEQAIPTGILPPKVKPKEGLAGLKTHVRLALEMALHEEAERRAIEGELELLEAAWQEAEEIAAISDNLLIPTNVEAQLDQLKNRGDRTP